MRRSSEVCWTCGVDVSSLFRASVFQCVCDPEKNQNQNQDVFPVCVCRACINQHLMNNKDCFFCKATITGVEDYSKPGSS